jgi:uncharacterized membrane protein YdjX (TVP38/TMEM64 family)
MKKAQPILSGLLFLGLGAAIVCLIPVRLLFDQAQLSHYLEANERWAAVLYLGIFVGATVLGFPGNVLTIAGGAVFGLEWGILLSQLGATLGAIGAFGVARYLFHGWLRRWFQHHRIWHQLTRAIAQRPLSTVLASRISPLAPFSLVNFLFGLTAVDLKTYVIGTFWGILPLTVVYTWLGVSGKTMLSGGDRLPLILALSSLSLLALLPGLRRRSRSSP